MTQPHVIEVLATDFGTFPAVARLNPMLPAEAALLKLTIRVNWHPPEGDGGARLLEVERRLAAAAPSLDQHQCRGPHQYRLFQGPEGQGGAAPAPRGRTADGPFEPALALAHLFEHVIIDAVAFLTEAPRVSGVTGERAEARPTFDVFVECPDRAVAEVAADLSRGWLEEALDGEALDGAVPRALELARRLYRARPAAVDAATTGRRLGQAPA